jgi:RNA polymerase sigma-70 factor (ECF subfamily)
METLAVGLATLSTTPLSAAPAPAPDGDAVDAALAAAGDQHAFERLYRRHATRMYNLARRMLGSEDVDDAVQDVFVRTWNKLGSFRGEAAFGTWLHRLAVNVVLGRRETRGIHAQRHHDDDSPLDSAPSRSVRPDLGMDFEQAMLQLPDGARRVFVLYDVEGYRHEEIAGMLQISVGTSKSQLHHARMALRRYLDQ